jgi:hypothetical protein
LLFPSAPCQVKLASTWHIQNSTSFTIDGGARCGLPGNCTRFQWAGNPGGTMIDMEGVFGFEMKNVHIDGAGIAGTGVIVDQNPSANIATYDGIFEGMLFDASANHAAGPHDGWVGLSVSPVSRANVADIQVINSAFECVAAGQGNGTIGYGLGLATGSQNALLEVIRHNYFEHCAYGIYQKSGGAIIEENTFGGDAHTVDDIYVGGISGPHERIVANWSETQIGHSSQFLKLDFINITGPAIEFSANQIPVNAVCAADMGGNNIVSRAPNVWYVGFSGGGGPKICTTHNGYALTWRGPSGLSWPQDVNSGDASHVVFFPGSLDNGPSTGLLANSAEAIAQGVPVKWTGAVAVTGTTPTDTAPGIVVGVAANAPSAPNRPAYVMTSGYIVMTADGDCSVGQFAVVSKQNAFRIQCVQTFVPGTVIGVVLLAEHGGGPVNVQIGLR